MLIAESSGDSAILFCHFERSAKCEAESLFRFCENFGDSAKILNCHIETLKKSKYLKN
ncbi:hypothetical protein [Helicobacter sp. 23-1045]